MGLTVTVPDILPVTLEQQKQQSRITHDGEDTLIRSHIRAATNWCQAFQARQYISATYVLTLPILHDPIEIPRSPLVSVTSITYTDTAEASQTLAATEYTVITSEEPPRIVQAYNKTWPATLPVDEAVTVTFVAGYGATAATVPDDIQHAIRLLAAHFYEHREAVITGTVSKEVELSVKALLWSDRVVTV